MLGSARYIVSSHTEKDWVVFTSKSKTIVCKRDNEVCQGTSYIDLHKNKVGMTMIETVCENFESYAKKGHLKG